MASSSREPFETVEFSKVRGLAERFEQAWDTQQDSSTGVDLIPFLPEPGDPARASALFELIKTDLSCRWQRGLPTSLELYVEKFPEIGPIENVSPKLIYEEYRIRTRHGFPAPLGQYKARFPVQFSAFEAMIQSEQSQAGMPTTASTPDISLQEQSNLTASLPQSTLAPVGSGTLVGGHYTLTKRIGTGGFGEVWLGNDIHGNIPKAIKVIFRSIESDEAKTELHALEIIKRLNHPYLLRTEGFFAEQERLIVVMELADGSLREMLKKCKKESESGLPVEKLLVYMRHAAEALDYLAEEGIFHRDIKPENILLVGKIAKVADFGLAKLAANRQSTKTNFAGTSAYSSPETWKGRVTARSDLYSLAATYGELRLGRPVFKGSTIYEFMIEHLQSQPNLEPMPEAEKAVMLRALAKDPADRYPTCAEFVRELERAIAGPGALPATGPSAAGAPTPVSKWSTPSSGSIDLNTQRPGNTLASKPPSWKSAPSQADIEVPEPEPYRRRRRRGANPVVVGLGAFAVIAAILSVISFLSRNSLEAKSQELVSKRDFSGALKTIDDGGLLAAPFKSSLRDDVLKSGLEMAEKAKKNDQLDDVVKTTVALVEAFPKDDRARTLLDDTLQKQVPEFVRRGKFGEAYAVLNSLPLSLAKEREQLPEIGRKWLDRAWEDIDNQDYAAAKKTTDDFLRVDPYQPDALALNDLIVAAENVRNLIIKGKYREVMDKIPRHLPERGKKLAEQLRGEVKTAWLKQAEELNKTGKYDSAQQSLMQFSKYFKNDTAGNALFKATLSNIFKEYFAQDRFEDALALLVTTNFEFADLADDLKQAWRDAELKRFSGGDDAAKERALKGLAKLTKQFGSDFALSDDYRKCRTAFVEGVLPRIDESLKARNFAKMLDLIAKVEPYVQDPTQETKLKSLELLAVVESPDAGPGDRKSVEKLLRQIMKQPEKVQRPDEILRGVLRIGGGDPAFVAALRPELLAFRDVIAEDKLPAEFWALPGMNKSDPTQAGSGARKILADVARLYDGSDFEQALKTLKQIDVKREEKGIKKQYYELYARLGEKGVLSRDQVLSLDSLAGEYPEIKPSLAKAMTAVIGQMWKTWPSGGDWTGRIKDADAADPKEPIVMAFKAEALLESGKAVDFDLAAGSGDEKPYVDYVAACVAAAKGKRDDLLRAAGLLERLSPKDAWLVAGRRDKASQILQSAAIEQEKAPDGSRRLFETAQESNQAFAWLDKALLLSSKSLKDATTLPWEAELTLALAAACKTPPAFDRNKTLGDDLFARRKAELSDGDRVNLALSNPAAFGDMLKKLKGDSLIGVNEVGAMIAIGDSQLETLPDDSALKQRQGELYALKGWALEQAEKKDIDAIFSAYSEAAKFDPTNSAVLVGKGRYGATVALARAANETNAESKIRILQQGIKVCEPALKKNFVNDEGWADLCLERSQLALDLGNEYFRGNQLDGLKEAFLDARNYAEKARDAKVASKHPADVWLALGNAFEDLAHFARIDGPKNYDEAAKALDHAAKLKPDYGYNAGRCRYRWANDPAGGLDEAQKKQTVNIALLNLAPVAANKKSPHAAEANYWEGFVNWYLLNYPKAFESFERALTLGEKNNEAAIWARYSLDAIAQLTRAQLKAEPERALQWVEATETAARPLKNIAAFKGTEQALNDLAAEANLELARKELTAKEFAKYKQHIARAAELKHSTKAYEIAVERAFKGKTNRQALELSPQNVTEIYDLALAAIDAMPTLSDAQKQKSRGEFEALWKKIP